MPKSKIYNCEVCNKIFEKPYQLSCGDTLCFSCLENEKNKSQNNNNNNNKNKFNCPICKDIVDAYFLNKRLNQEIEEFKKSQCKIHSNEKIISFCENCNCNICKECSTSSNHRGHIFTSMTDSKFELIFKEFQNNQYQSLLEYKKDLLERGEKVKDNFNKSNENSINQLKLLNSTFSNLHSSLKQLESQLEFQIKKSQELNQLSNTKLSSLVNDVELLINKIINRNDKYFNSSSVGVGGGGGESVDHQNQMIKQLFETNMIAIIDDFSETNNLLNNKSNVNPNEFTNSILNINNNELDKFNQSLNSIFKIDSIIIQDEQSSSSSTTKPQTQPIKSSTSPFKSSSPDIGLNLPPPPPMPILTSKSSMELVGNNNSNSNNKSNQQQSSSSSLQPQSQQGHSLNKSQSANNINKLGGGSGDSISKSTSNSSIKSSYSTSSSNGEIDVTLQSLPNISNIPSPNRISKMYSSNSNLNSAASANKEPNTDIFIWNLVDPIPPSTTSVCVMASKELIPAGSIPKKVTSLVFSGYNQPLKEGSIPDTVLNLHLGNSFNQDIAPQSLPTSITSLHLGSKFNKPLLDGSIPYGVLDLHIGDSFNQPINRTLPSSILSLNLGGTFNQKLSPGDIPSSCSLIRLSMDFNQQLSPGVIPNSCKTLIFGYCYNQVILPNVLPKDMDVLELSYCFNQTLVQGCIPNVSKLIFGYHFNKPIKHSGIIPSTVTHLTYGSLFNQPLSKYNVPKSTISLTLPDTYVTERSGDISNISSNTLVSYRPKDF